LNKGAVTDGQVQMELVLLIDTIVTYHCMNLTCKVAVIHLLLHCRYHTVIFKLY